MPGQRQRPIRRLHIPLSHRATPADRAPRPGGDTPRGLHAAAVRPARPELSASRCSRPAPIGGAVDRWALSRSSTSNATSNAATTARTAIVQQVVRAVKVVKLGPVCSSVRFWWAVPRYKPTIASRCSVSGPCTNAAAISGSVGPVPNEGQSFANTHTPHAGLRAWQTRRPWKMTR